MNRFPLVPALSLVAIVLVLIVGDKVGMTESFRRFAMFLGLSIPVIGVGGLASFAYDFAKRKNSVSSVPFPLRMALHSIGLLILIGSCVVIAGLPNFHQ